MRFSQIDAGLDVVCLFFFVFSLETIFYFIDYSDLFDRSVVSWMSAGWRGGL